MKSANEDNNRIDYLLNRLEEVSNGEVDVRAIRLKVENIKQEAREKAKSEIAHFSYSTALVAKDVTSSVISSASLGAILGSVLITLVAPPLGIPIITGAFAGLGAILGLSRNRFLASKRKKEIEKIRLELEQEISIMVENEVKITIQEELEQKMNSTIEKLESESLENE